MFNNLYVNMAKAGEAGGVLEVVLNRLAEFLEKAERIKRKIKGAMTYPIVVLCAALGITGFLMTTVIPKFKGIFKDLMDGQQLPGITNFVIACSRVVASKQAFILIAGIVAIVIILSAWYRTRSGRLAIDRLKLRLRPDVRGMVRAVEAGDLPGIARRVFNVFESALSRSQAEQVQSLKSALLDAGALGAAMTGSGSGVFALFPDGDTALSAARTLRARGLPAEPTATAPRLG